MEWEEKELTPKYSANKNKDYHLVSASYVPGNVYSWRWILFYLDNSENDITVSLF